MTAPKGNGVSPATSSLAQELLRGDARSLARAMSLVENGAPEAEALPMAEAPEPCTSRDRGVLRTDSALEATGLNTLGEPAVEDEAGEVVLSYCAAVRGILNDDQGGPLHPPGLRMSEALQEVHASLDRNLRVQKGGVQSHC